MKVTQSCYRRSRCSRSARQPCPRELGGDGDGLVTRSVKPEARVVPASRVHRPDDDLSIEQSFVLRPSHDVQDQTVRLRTRRTDHDDLDLRSPLIMITRSAGS